MLEKSQVAQYIMEIKDKHVSVLQNYSEYFIS